jgi:hypothetical protein
MAMRVALRVLCKALGRSSPAFGFYFPNSPTAQRSDRKKRLQHLSPERRFVSS